MCLRLPLSLSQQTLTIWDEGRPREVRNGSKMRNIHPEWMSSALPPNSDIAATAVGTSHLCQQWKAAPLFDHRVGAGENPECSQPSVQRTPFGNESRNPYLSTSVSE
jgi:hypothetical protein